MTEETVYKAQKTKAARRFNFNGTAVALIAIGLGLLVFNLNGGDLLDYLWPIVFIGLPGLLFLRPAYLATEDNQSGLMWLAIPGAILTTLSGLLFVMNLTDHFEAFAYAWTLIPMSVFAGIMYAKRFDREARIHTTGERLIRGFGYAFLGLAVLFELLIFESLGPWWPLMLVVMGVYLFVRERRVQKEV